MQRAFLSKPLVCLPLLTSTVLVLAAVAACSPAAPSNDGAGGKTAMGGAVGTGGSPATSGGATSGGSISGGAPSSGGATSGGAPATGGASAGGAPNTGGSAGATAGGGTGGNAGAGTGGAAAGNSSGGAAGGGSGGGSGSGGAAAACPANATFCSGFEEAGLPKGAVYKLNGDPATPWTRDFELDTTVRRGGNAALRVRDSTENGSGAYKMLAVPAPGPAFWVRFYLRSNVDLGASDHNVYAYASGSDNPNDSTFVEFAEDVGIAFNSHDIVRWPMGYGRLMGGGTMPFTLPKDTWHCIEISFDGTNRTQQLFINGEQKINAAMYPEMTQAFTTFKFGYNALHGTNRKTWYDDVAVAPSRINCL